MEAQGGEADRVAVRLPRLAASCPLNSACADPLFRCPATKSPAFAAQNNSAGSFHALAVPGAGDL